MSAYAWLELAVISTLVIWSAWMLLGRLLPNVRNRLLRAVGRTPPAAATGCDSGCSSCSGCASAGTSTAHKPGDVPIRFDALR